ncbi:hypothetical protein ABW20_dc0109368 [Dactylellina cionopaga]|nr:hypothetical protein ABW20_dc0109368 [Dactylellina cionopaga]
MKFTTVAIAAAMATLASATYANVYARCGGIGYTGPNCNPAQATCTYINAYYSQVC